MIVRFWHISAPHHFFRKNRFSAIIEAMERTASQKGKVFTGYSIFIILIVTIVGLVLFLAGDFVYSQIRPVEPTITSPVSGTTVGNNPPTFQGEMPLNATLKIYVDEKELATYRPEATTIWTYTPEMQLEIGDHTMHVIAIGEEGLKSRASSGISFNVPQRPQITSMYNGEEFSGESPPLSGEAAAGVEINLYMDDQYIESTRSNTQGKWSFEELEEMRPGKHSVYVTAVKTLGVFNNKSEEFDFMLVLPQLLKTDTQLPSYSYE